MRRAFGEGGDTCGLDPLFRGCRCLRTLPQSVALSTPRIHSLADVQPAESAVVSAKFPFDLTSFEVDANTMPELSAGVGKSARVSLQDYALT